MAAIPHCLCLRPGQRQLARARLRQKTQPLTLGRGHGRAWWPLLAIFTTVLSFTLISFEGLCMVKEGSMGCLVTISGKQRWKHLYHRGCEAFAPATLQAAGLLRGAFPAHLLHNRQSCRAAWSVLPGLLSLSWPAKWGGDGLAGWLAGWVARSSFGGRTHDLFAAASHTQRLWALTSPPQRGWRQQAGWLRVSSADRTPPSGPWDPVISVLLSCAGPGDTVRNQLCPCLP